MIKKNNSVGIAGLVLVLSLAITACGGGNSNTSESAAASSSGATPAPTAVATPEATPSAPVDDAPAASQVLIEDILWSVSEGILDEERYMLLNYTNNSPYTLAGFRITFTEKDDIPEETRTLFYEDLKTDFELSDDDLSQIQDVPIASYAESEFATAPGESAENINLFYYTGWLYLKNKDHFDLVEPDIATIRFVDDDKIYTEYYDFHSGEYSFESDTEPAQYWTTTALGDMIPRPEAPVVVCHGVDDEDTFMFKAYGYTLDTFNAYVEECKSMGYTLDAAEHSGFYSADNNDGFNVYINFEEGGGCLSMIFSGPDDNASSDEGNSADQTDESGRPAGDDEIRPDFKAFVDEYEAFMNEYVDFVKRYNSAEDATEMLDEYYELIDQQIDYMSAVAEYDEEDLTVAEAKYLLDAKTRVNSRLAEIGE